MDRLERSIFQWQQQQQQPASISPSGQSLMILGPTTGPPPTQPLAVAPSQPPPIQQLAQLIPLVDMVDCEDAYQFLVDVPGAAMRDIRIDLVGPDALLVRVQANRAMPFAGGASSFHPTAQPSTAVQQPRRSPQLMSGERIQPPYERLIRIPIDGDRQRSTAKLAAGVLNITVCACHYLFVCNCMHSCVINYSGSQAKLVETDCS